MSLLMSKVYIGGKINQKLSEKKELEYIRCNYTICDSVGL